MTPLACPSCGAPIPFRTSFTVFAVCSYCGAAVVRHDRDVTGIGRVADLKNARCIGSEGELPFAAPVGRTALHADMLSQSGGFASAEYGPDGMRLFLGRNIAFNALRPRNLRPVEGWTTPVFT